MIWRPPSYSGHSLFSSDAGATSLPSLSWTSEHSPLTWGCHAGCRDQRVRTIPQLLHILQSFQLLKGTLCPSTAAVTAYVSAVHPFFSIRVPRASSLFRGVITARCVHGENARGFAKFAGFFIMKNEPPPLRYFPWCNCFLRGALKLLLRAPRPSVRFCGGRAGCCDRGAGLDRRCSARLFARKRFSRGFY